MFFFLLFGSGCSQSGLLEDSDLLLPDKPLTRAGGSESAAPAYEFTFEEDKALLEEMGYDTSYMVEYEDCYFVGTEYVFGKSTLAEYRKTLQPKLNFETKLYAVYQHLNLNCYWFDYSDTDLVKKAVAEWNTIGNCNIAFGTNLEPEKVQYDWGFNMDIKPFDDNSLLRYEPMTIPGTPGSGFKINTSYKLWPQLSNDMKKYLIMHGMGHIIGLKDYTDTMSDMFSIMQSERLLSEQNLNIWSGFSFLDKKDLQQKYPLVSDPKYTCTIVPQPEGGKNYLEALKEYRVTLNYTNPTVPKPVYSYTLTGMDPGVDFVIFDKSETAFSFYMITPGACKLTVKILKNNIVQNTYEEIFQSIGNRFTCPSNPVLGVFQDFNWSYWHPDYPNATITYQVKEHLFDGDTGCSATIEPVKNGQVRIRFDDYGSYTVEATMKNGPYYVPNRKFYFNKLYRVPSYKYTCYDREVGEGGKYPLDLSSAPTTEPFGFHPFEIFHYYVDLEESPVMEARFIGDVHMDCEQLSEAVRYAIRIHFPGPVTRIVLDKGASSRQNLPDLYHMFHPDSLIYMGHYAQVWQDYTEITYPVEDGHGTLQ